jgi:hypothetical protein
VKARLATTQRYDAFSDYDLRVLGMFVAKVRCVQDEEGSARVEGGAKRSSTTRGARSEARRDDSKKMPLQKSQR